MVVAFERYSPMARATARRPTETSLPKSGEEPSWGAEAASDKPHGRLRHPRGFRASTRGEESDHVSPKSLPLAIYATPALKVGEEYNYLVTATWMENGRQVKEDRSV